MEGDNSSIFKDISAEISDPEVTEIESLCTNCFQNGVTRILLTRIPFYKEIVVMSFECTHCGFSNNEVQSGGKVEEKGIRIVVNVSEKEDLNRQVVKSNFTSIKIPELEFEIPAQSQKGEITTIEGIIERSIKGLEQDQEKRWSEDKEGAEQIDEFLSRLQKLKDVESPFTLILEDISGNCDVQNPNAPIADDRRKITHFNRSINEDHLLGIYKPDEVEDIQDEEKWELKPGESSQFALENLENEVLQFPTQCPNCSRNCETNMKVTNVPYFKEVVIMATNCEYCGHRTNEVKSGGGIEPKGIEIEVKISSNEDMCRDVLKSETCSLSIPDLNVEVGAHALNGRFTTVEGIIKAMKDQLESESAMFGDSADEESKLRFNNFLNQLADLLSLKKSASLVLNDPAGNSYVQSLTAPEPDPNVRVTYYERTFDQNEELGLNDMKVENYQLES